MQTKSLFENNSFLADAYIDYLQSNSIAKMPVLLPLGALLLAGSLSAVAQTDDANRTLKAVVVKEKAEAPEGKDALRATETTIGKGKQQLRDIPQSVTVVTEKLIVDRNLDTVKEALKNTSGISFLAAEGGEEDIRLRGLSLQATGDIFIDGMRDPAFYERDTFNLDRLEVLRGSASMLSDERDQHDAPDGRDVGAAHRLHHHRSGDETRHPHRLAARHQSGARDQAADGALERRCPRQLLLERGQSGR